MPLHLDILDQKVNIQSGLVTKLNEQSWFAAVHSENKYYVNEMDLRIPLTLHLHYHKHLF